MKSKHILSGLLATLFMVACQDEYSRHDAQLESVKVSAGIPATRVDFTGGTSGVTYAEWTDGDAIELFTASQNGLHYTASFVTGEETYTDFVPSGEALLNKEEDAVYASFSANQVDHASKKVMIGQSPHWQECIQPFLYAVDTIRNGQLNLRFKHVYSYLRLTLTEGMLPEDATSTTVGKLILFSDASLSVVEGSFDFSTEKLEVTTGGGIELNTGNHDLKQSSLVYYIPVIPQAGGVNIQMETYSDMTSDTPFYTLEKQVPAGGFLAGHVYSLTLERPDLSSIVVGPSSVSPLAADATMVTSTLTFDESLTIAEKGFCYDFQPAPTVSSQKAISTADSKNEISADITGLIPDSTYYVRAYAICDGVPIYGEECQMSSAGIYSLEDLVAFRDAHNADADVKKWKKWDGGVNIYADIDLSSIDNWIMINSIGAREYLDGNGHVLSGLKMNDVGVDGGRLGFVGELSGSGEIRNLHIGSGEINITGESIGYCGTICGDAGASRISDCSSKVNITVATANGVVAGIVGYGGYIQNCINYGNITGGFKISGICGELSGSTNVKNCANHGTLTGIEGTRMVSGMSQNMYGNTSIAITQCENHGTLHGEYADEVGGITAFATYTRVTGCVNYGHVIGGNKAGGICGRSYSATLNDNRNEGAVEGPEGALVGGICGEGSIGSGNMNNGTVNGVSGSEENAVGG